MDFLFTILFGIFSRDSPPKTRKLAKFLDRFKLTNSQTRIKLTEWSQSLCHSWGTLRLQFGGAEKCSLGGFAIRPLRCNLPFSFLTDRSPPLIIFSPPPSYILFRARAASGPLDARVSAKFYKKSSTLPFSGVMDARFVVVP